LPVLDEPTDTEHDLTIGCMSICLSVGLSHVDIDSRLSVAKR